MVGFDGSTDAGAALRFALEEAAMRRSSLRVVAAVELPDYGLAAPTMVTLPPPDHLVNDVRKATQTYVDQAVAARDDKADGVPIAVEAIAGHPGQVLCSAADGAALVVVGHRGRGAVASAIIGSVGMHCVLNASCPVAIVRSDT